MTDFRISDLPTGWRQTSLGEILDRLQYGFTASASSGPGPRFLRITDLTSAGVDWTTVPTCSASDSDADKYRLHDGDFVFARSGSIEKAWRVRSPPPSVFASYLIRGQPVDGRISDWLEQFIRSPSYLAQIGAAGAGIGMQNVNATNLSAVSLPVPPLAEQKRIVAKIEDLTARSRRAKAALDAVPPLLDQLRQSILAAAFRGDLTADWRAKNPSVTPSKQQLHAWQPRGDRLNAAILTSEETEASAGGYPSSWEKVRLGEAAEIFVGFAFEAKQFTPAGVRLLRGVNIGIGRTKWEDTVLIEHSASPPDYLLRPGDIVVAMDRPFISGGFRVAQLTDEDTPSYLVQRVARLRPAGAATGDYVYTFLTSARFHRHLTARVTGTSVPHISGIDIGSAWMPLPPLQEQAELTHRVAQAFKRIKAVEALVTTQQNQLAEFDQAILAKAFRGELVPQDPNDEPAAVLLERIRAARAEASAAPRRRGRVTREEAAPAVEVPAEPTRASPRPSTTAATELDPDLLQSHVFAALWTHGPLDKDAAVRRLADHLRQAGVVDYQRLRADGPLYATLLAALESAARAGLLDRPGRGLLRASKPDPTAYTTDDWRHALLATLPPTPTDRDQAIRAAADWSRHHLGLEFTRLPTDGHIATGLRSAINSAIRRHEITRHSPTLISRAQNKTQLPLPLAPPTPRRP